MIVMAFLLHRTGEATGRKLAVTDGTPMTASQTIRHRVTAR